MLFWTRSKFHDKCNVLFPRTSQCGRRHALVLGRGLGFGE
ncbi:hypothetical protein PITC_053210 [Penicillium italicum]|uniref:Uncharacterized protein n=1 Tax=Penicillium italicum TaxID=40296 RepID=A0A0A2KM65_PENIT|nr:hypothetical protein PITC_053210 [Penicillium italicum]